MWTNIFNITSSARHRFARTWLPQFILTFVCSAPTTVLYFRFQKGFAPSGHRHFHTLFLLSHINTCLSWVSSSVLTSSEQRMLNYLAQKDSPIICGSDSKESTCNSGDLGLVPGLGRSPRGGHGNPPQYSCLENSQTEEPGRLQFMGSQRAGQDWATEHISTFFQGASGFYFHVRD